MQLRAVLADNLKALMAVRPGLDTLKKIVAASDGRLSNGKLDRVRRAASDTDIGTLDELAQVFGVEPWHLLVENLDPLSLPNIDDDSLLDRIKALVLEMPVVDSVDSGTTTEAVRSAPRLSPGRHQKQLSPPTEETLFQVRTSGANNAGRTNRSAAKQGGRKRA
jgi:hypothetical protein